MKRWKNAIVVIVENSQMAFPSTIFYFFYFKKVEVRKLENFKKLLYFFKRLLHFFEGLLHFLGEKWAAQRLAAALAPDNKAWFKEN